MLSCAICLYDLHVYSSFGKIDWLFLYFVTNFLYETVSSVKIDGIRHCFI